MLKNVEKFREARPYTWSGDTHADASAWASELRDKAVEGRRNLIIDTTLGNPERASEMIRELQAKGYTVEVRALAAHRLESELGVDKRFTESLDQKGYGRYVPQEVRDHVYKGLPDNLNKVQAGTTDVPIRIFNREGKELYDSRTSEKLPGDALTQARQDRVASPRLTRSLSEGWNEQQVRHQELPQSLERNPKVSPPTAQTLLGERDALKVVPEIERNAQQIAMLDEAVRIRPQQFAVKGLAAAGTVAMAYDAATTTRDAARLVGQGNITGAESQVMHFGGRTGGMFAGAAAGAEIGAVLGVESGPGMLVTAGIGGIAGAVGGDKLMDAVDRQSIYGQRGSDGHTWNMDAAHPEQGWTRRATGPDLEQIRTRQMRGEHVSETLRAQPALSDELNYKASGKAVELALAHPPTPRDPYTIPSSEHDARSLREAPWTREPTTHQWTRHVAEGLLDPKVMSYRTDVATPSRAAELERASQAIIADNLDHSPRAIAEQYQTAYTQYGWQQHGAMPDAVTHALKTPTTTLQVSNGHTYTRDANGQWQTPGMLYGTNTAEGNLRNEFDATYARGQDRVASYSTTPPAVAQTPAEPAKAVDAPKPAPSPDYLSASATLQRITTAMEHGNLDALRKEGLAFTQSARGLAIMEHAHATVQREEQQRAQREAQQPPRDPRDARHPDHVLNGSIRKQVETLHCRAGIFISNQTLDHLTAGVALDARKQGLSRVDQLYFSADKGTMLAEQKSNTYDVLGKHSTTNVQHAMQTPPEQSYQQMGLVTQQQAQAQQERQQQAMQARAHQGPVMGR